MPAVVSLDQVRRVPQLEDGYTRIANELYEAIVASPLSARELKVVLAVIRKTYGYGKKSDPISLSQLSEITGLDRSHCGKAVRSLVAKNVLIKEICAVADRLELQKNYAGWRFGVAKTATCGQNGHKTVAKTATTKDKKESRQKLTLLSVDRRGAARFKRDRKVLAWLAAQFDVFWNTFAHKNGKAGALKSWNTLAADLQKKPVREIKARIAHVLQAAQLEADRRPALRIDGRTPMMAQGWLSQERYDDEDLQAWGKYSAEVQVFVDVYNAAASQRGARFLPITEWTEKRQAFFERLASRGKMPGWKQFTRDKATSASIPQGGVTIDWLINNMHQFREGRA